jgi:hypothetical protein
MKIILSKFTSVMMAAFMALLTMFLVIPRATLNAACWAQGTTPCPDKLDQNITAPPPGNPAGLYNCYGNGTYRTVSAASSGSAGFSGYQPDQQTCVNTCYRIVNNIQYVFDKDFSAYGNSVILTSPACTGGSGPPP